MAHTPKIAGTRGPERRARLAVRMAHTPNRGDERATCARASSAADGAYPEKCGDERTQLPRSGFRTSAYPDYAGTEEKTRTGPPGHPSAVFFVLRADQAKESPGECPGVKSGRGGLGWFRKKTPLPVERALDIVDRAVLLAQGDDPRMQRGGLFGRGRRGPQRMPVRQEERDRRVLPELMTQQVTGYARRGADALLDRRQTRGIWRLFPLSVGVVLTQGLTWASRLGLGRPPSGGPPLLEHR